MDDWQLDMDMLQRIIDALPLGVWIADTKGNLKLNNPAGRSIWQGERWVGPEEYRQYRGWWSHSGEPLQPEDWGMARAVLHGESSQDEMVDIACFDGARKTILNSAALIYDAAGKPRCAVATNQDITRLKATQDALQETREQLAALSQQVLAIQERERHRLSRELHDEIGQSLTALKITLETCRQSSTERRDDLLQHAIDITHLLVGDVREIARRLRPPQLEELGLLPALRTHLDGLAQISPLVFSLQGECTGWRMPEELELACFRLVQESVNNVIRHANASHVTVGLKCRAGWLDLAISDDGCGFDQHALKTRSPNYFPLGLLGMRERAAGLNGSLTIDSTPGAGTTVRARFPLEPA